MMAATESPKAVVCRATYVIDGRPAYYVIDWHGVRSEDWVVGEDETEQEVIDRLSSALWMVRPRGAGARPQRPLLRLL